jgi:hypothetical protein
MTCSHIRNLKSVSVSHDFDVIARETIPSSEGSCIILLFHDGLWLAKEKRKDEHSGGGKQDSKLKYEWKEL